MSSSKYRRACGECQIRHLKCDLAKPCRPCTEEGRTCIEQLKYQFRHDFNPSIASKRKRGRSSRFQPSQPWSKLPKHLRFTDSDPSLELQSQDLEAASLNDSSPGGEKAIDHTVEECLAIGHSSPRSGSGCSDLNNYNPFSSSFPGTPTLASAVDGRSSPFDALPFDDQQPLWPLSNKDEALLLQYFATDLALWFDYCGKSQSFSTIVIPAAATSPTLLNAILAVTARHLSLAGKFDRYAADRYQHECLKTLIPELANPEALLDDKLFAATVILRFFHEMTETIDGLSPSQHVLGSHMLMQARERARTQITNTTTSSLRFAALRIELRQEIHIAFMTNRPPPKLVGYCNIDRTLEPTDDWMWTWRIIAHTADTLTYCNGDGAKTFEQWKELWDYLETWEKAIPPSFRPIFEEEADPGNGKLFPELWHANDCHAAGHHYLAISSILLLAHDPQLPPLGPNRAMALKESDRQIKDLILKICGITCSNRRFLLLIFSAAVSIAMCGERFTERAEQEALIEILADAEAHIIWPCLRSAERLKNGWGWG